MTIVTPQTTFEELDKHISEINSLNLTHPISLKKLEKINLKHRQLYEKRVKENHLNKAASFKKEKSQSTFFNKIMNIFK